MSMLRPFKAKIEAMKKNYMLDALRKHSQGAFAVSSGRGGDDGKVFTELKTPLGSIKVLSGKVFNKALAEGDKVLKDELEKMSKPKILRKS